MHGPSVRSAPHAQMLKRYGHVPFYSRVQHARGLASVISTFRSTAGVTCQKTSVTTTVLRMPCKTVRCQLVQGPVGMDREAMLKTRQLLSSGDPTVLERFNQFFAAKAE